MFNVHRKVGLPGLILFALVAGAELAAGPSLADFPGEDDQPSVFPLIVPQAGVAAVDEVQANARGDAKEFLQEAYWPPECVRFTLLPRESPHGCDRAIASYAVGKYALTVVHSYCCHAVEIAKPEWVDTPLSVPAIEREIAKVLAFQGKLTFALQAESVEEGPQPQGRVICDGPMNEKPWLADVNWRHDMGRIVVWFLPHFTGSFDGGAGLWDQHWFTRDDGIYHREDRSQAEGAATRAAFQRRSQRFQAFERELRARAREERERQRASTAEPVRLSDYVMKLSGNGTAAVFVDQPCITNGELLCLRRIPDLIDFTAYDSSVLDSQLPMLRDLPRLQRLTLANAGIGDAGAAHLALLPGLRQLHLRQNRLTDAAMTSLGKLHQLELLDVSQNAIGDAGLAQVQGLTHLHFLTLNKTRISNAGLASLRPLVKLICLNLADTAVDDQGLPHVKGLSKLAVLNVRRTGITDAGLNTLLPLSQLEEIHLDGTAVTDAGLPRLAQCTKIRQLSLMSTRVTDAGLAALLPLVNLKVLSLDRTAVSEVAMQHLRKLKSLEVLQIHDVRTSEDDYRRFKQALPQADVVFRE